ncbi:hypothetical protein PBRA_006673 [Plasmodiophora brassicae]|nr:hypothetical protein PBRA_006673 [Plasmodiophora brassicae]
MFAPVDVGGEAPDTHQQPEPPVVEGKRARSQQQVWKAHEVELLQQGVARYGRNWKAILDDRDFAPTLGGRSAGSLKLKWYKMSKEHEEKMSASSRLWGHHALLPPGESMSMLGMEGDLGGPFGKSFIDGGFCGRMDNPGETTNLLDPFRPEEIQALKEGTARYGANWPAILTDPNYAVPLMNRSPAALQYWWNQLQGMPKPSQLDGNNQDECSSEGMEGAPNGSQSGLQSMRSWGRLETDALVKGFEMYGTDWKAILMDARYRPHLAHRTAHSLKSKWARMMKKRKRDDDARQFGVQSPMPLSLGFHAGPVSGFMGHTIGSQPPALGDCFSAAPYSVMDEGRMAPTMQPWIDTADKYDRSIDEYTKEIAANPSNPILYNHRGVVYYAKGMLDQAIDDFSTAIALDCSYADAFTNRGMAFNSKGEFDLAIMDCTTTIDINPMSASAANAYLTRALTHYNKGVLDQCIADCDATLALRPRCVSALVTRGLTVLARAKEGSLPSSEAMRCFGNALRDFKEALQIDPTNSQARVWHEEAAMLLNNPSLRAADASSESVLPTPATAGGTNAADTAGLPPPGDGPAPCADTLTSRFMH